MDLAWAGAAALLAAALASDLRSMTIPNRLTVPAFAAGLLHHALRQGWGGLGYAAAGAAVGFGVMLLLYALRGVGAGDVKLFAALGAWLGAADIWHALIGSILFGGVCGVALLIARRTALGRLLGRRVLAGAARESGMPGAAQGARLQFPFMLAAVPGTLVGCLM